MIDVIGTIYKLVGEPFVGEDGFITQNTVAIDGFHVNIQPEDMRDDLLPYVVTPSTPSRIFAGDNPENPQFTICLKFADEAEYLTLFPLVEE